jgi:hypothetical protein
MISIEYIGNIKGSWIGAGESTLAQKKPRLSEIEKCLTILGYLEIFDSNEYSLEKKMITLNEAVEFIRQNSDTELSYCEAYERIFEYLFSYRKKRNIKSRENPERIRCNPGSRDDKENNLRPKTVRRDLTEDSIRRILYKHLIVQTLLIFWILLILLIKIDSISIFLSNPTNQALLGISSVIFSFIIYVMASK